jgi:RNA polymerase sigma-19 factor, ECF subfamily
MTTITELFERAYQPLIGRGIKQGFGPDDAEELASETFAQLLTKDEPTGALMTAIHRARMIDSRRHRPSAPTQTERPIGVEVELRPGQSYTSPAPVRTEDDHMFGVELRACLDRCRPADAQAFVLHYINGLTYDEIGQRLGISRQRIHQRAENARLRIIKEVAA